MKEGDLNKGTLAAGAVLGHYRIVGELGRGGMGEVYRAEDRKLQRQVALKVLSAEVVSTPGRLARFEREARAVAALNHPNIVTIYSVDEVDGCHFITMELVEGATLGHRIPGQGMTLEALFALAIPLADALAAAHRKGIVHRDLKPDNLMVDDRGELRILDFGLAKLSAEPTAVGATHTATVPLTEAGRVLGTLPYMSPEQLQSKAADSRSDIFSLGVILYQMAAGRRPFQGLSSADLISAILRDTPEPLTELRADLPRHFGRIVGHCLEKDPEHRYQSALDVRNELQQLRKEVESDEAMPARPAAGGYRRRGRRRRSAADESFSTSGISPARRATLSRTGLTLLLAAVFAFNWLETWLETLAARHWALASDLGLEIARSMHRLEGLFSFHGHDATNAVAVYGYSVSYFFVLPLLALLVAVTLAGREALAPYRVYTLAIIITYGVSLPFYLFFPVPERWAYPDSGAILLSDLWTSRLIETLRPISGLDNCFPSFHTSLTVVVVAMAFLFGLRLRWCIAALGGTIVLATFVLGIHWLADIVAGLATGVLGTALAVRAERRLSVLAANASL